MVVVLTVPIGAKFDRIRVRTKRVLWQHMAADFGSIQPHYEEPERSAWDARVYVSHHQMAAHISRGGNPGMVIGNGACPSFLEPAPLSPNFVTRGEPPRMIFSSAPGRGLDFLLTAFPTLRRKTPGLTLALCTDLSLDQIAAEDDRFSLYYDWEAALEGVEMIGAVSQPRLAHEMARSDIWGFPSRVTESACIAMMEAGLAGCRLIACDLGALPETSGGHARLLPLRASRLIWTESFAEAVTEEISIISGSPTLANGRRENARSWFRSNADWSEKAKEWERLGERLTRT
jgi:glycosyltransferase involved in cell wall biosynthesis